MRPPMPDLTPITRGTGSLIPREVLLAQVRAMDRRGTWHLAQAIRLQEGFDDGSVEENRYSTNLLTRHLQFAGALLGSINSRVTTFKFLQEDPHDYPGGHADRYGEARNR